MKIFALICIAVIQLTSAAELRMILKVLVVKVFED